MEVYATVYLEVYLSGKVEVEPDSTGNATVNGVVQKPEIMLNGSSYIILSIILYSPVYLDI